MHRSLPHMRFLLVQVVTQDEHQFALKNMQEAEQLVQTFGGQVIDRIIQRRNNPHPGTYIGTGKVEELLEIVEHQEIDVVVINSIVPSSQLFRLERAIWKVNTKIAVWDRVDLILAIFDQHARTTEAKLQIELARVQHIGPRIYGLGKTELSRQGGGIGTRGSGETNIEFERRKMKTRVQQLKKELAKLSKQKQQRITFRKEQGFGPAALVGYTSAGKTTLFNTLTGKEKQTEQGLFTTLDTVVGKMKTPDQRLPVLISDTIGFIDDLPPKLIDAFRSTLMESLEAKLLLHVIDANDSQIEKKMQVVRDILTELKADQPMILVFNKMDMIEEDDVKKLQEQFAEHEHVFLSAKTGEGVETLKKMITTHLVHEENIE